MRNSTVFFSDSCFLTGDSSTTLRAGGRNGFALMELLLVLAVIVILGAMAYPTFESLQGDLRLRQAADQIRGVWALGRVQAANEGRPYRFAVVPNKGNYRLAPDSSDFWGGGGPDLSGTTGTSDRPVIIEAALPRGVRVSTADSPATGFDATDDTLLPPGQVDPGMYNRMATFMPDGTCQEDVSVIFASRGNQPIVLKLRGITGGVTVKPYDPSSSKP